MKIELINVSIHKAISSNIKRRPKSTNYPSLGLIIIAGLTPANDDVSIINDDSQEINYNSGADLVGLSFLTPAAYRAYEIADKFRRNNVSVVMGGVHVSALPDEAGEHADAVVVGEAEGIWPGLLEDFKNGKLKKIYKLNHYAELSKVPYARRDLLNKKDYITTNVIQTSRGCPFDCEFCSVGDLFGRKTRFRPVKDVIGEIKTFDKQIILFTDDNLAINKSYTKELFEALIPLKRDWVGEASWTIKNDPELLDLAEKSGCRGLLIGFESIHPQDHVRKVSKHQDMKQAYRETVQKLHDHGIAIVGAFVFGFDNDDETVFNETLKFVRDVDIEIVEFNTIIPFPGTPLYSRLRREDRIFENDWRKYTYYPPGLCFYLKHMPVEELKNNIGRIYREFYSLKLIILRMISVWRRFRSIKMVVLLFLISFGYRKRIRHGF